IPVTTVARTIFDLAAALPKHDVESAISQADYRRLTDLLSLGDLVARYPRRRGTRTLRKLLAEGAAMSRSELERAFLAFVDAQGLEKATHERAHPRRRPLARVRRRVAKGEAHRRARRLRRAPDAQRVRRRPGRRPP